ncbi:MAG: SMC family ATPase [Thermoplasmata archaeon]
MEMIIRSVELKNIRSYREGIIEFPRGRVVLLGDIGAGKSTILMSIEFALFGLGDQDGSSLLRVNENSGHVILEMEIDNRIYKIKRALKRKNGRVTQDKVVIEENGRAESFTPTEAKAYIMKILNYNEPLNPRARSTIFRYAIYTPQEEMKKILNANPEERKKTIRKAFRIEDYSIARENSKIVIDYLKEKHDYYSGKGVGIEEIKGEIEQIDKEIYEIDKEIGKNLEIFNKLNIEINELNVKIERINEEMKEISEKIGRLTLRKKDLDELNSQYEDLNKEIEKAEKDLKKLYEGHEKNLIIREYRKDEIDNELNEIDKKIRELNEKRGELKSYEGSLREIRKNKEELKKKIDINYIKKLESEVENLRSEILKISINKPEKSKEELDQMEKEIEKEIRSMIKKSENINSKISDYEAILKNGICPTCDREAKPEDFISRLENKRMEKLSIDKKLEELEKKRDEIKKEKENISNYEIYATKLDILQAKENELKEKGQDMVEKEEKLKEYQRMEKEIEGKLREISLIENNIRSMESKKEELRKIRLKIEEYEKEENKIELMKREIESKKKELEKTFARIESIKKEIMDLEQYENMMKKRKSEHDELKENKEKMDKERERINNNIITLNTRKNEKIKLKESKLNEIREKERSLRLAQRYMEYYNWIIEVFLPALESIEKTILEMRRIEFNESFQRWFYMLVDDPTKAARIDEDFTPIVEQDGYVQEMEYLSGGERSAVALSYRLSLNSVVREVSLNDGENLLILDEPTDGFSSEQIQRFPEILNQTRSDQVIIVSHEADISRLADYTIRIRKDNGVSYIINSGNF